MAKLRTPSIARWKALGRFPIVIVDLFSLSHTVETLQAEICRSRRFSKGASPANHCWYTKKLE